MYLHPDLKVIWVPVLCLNEMGHVKFFEILLDKWLTTSDRSFIQTLDSIMVFGD